MALITIWKRIACRSKGWELCVCFVTLVLNFLNPTGYYTYHQVQISKILHADYIAYTCFVRLSEETVTFALYIIN